MNGTRSDSLKRGGKHTSRLRSPPTGHAAMAARKYFMKLMNDTTMSDTILRQAIVTRLGPFPPKVPLDLEQKRETDQGDHIRALVTYAVEPGERVSAWLLRPK